MRFRKETRQERRRRFNKTRKVAKATALVGVGYLTHVAVQANSEKK
jgi:hypothetical protein